MKKIQQGFTLIELMIVVAIIGILAAIAIPAYQDYTIRSQVTEGMNLASSVKTAVAERYANTGQWPTALFQIGMSLDGTAATETPPQGKYVASIDLGPAGGGNLGTIRIVYGLQANAAITAAATNALTMRPGLSTNQDVIWVCGYASDVNLLAAGMTYTDQAGNASTADASTILPKYLPSACRA